MHITRIEGGPRTLTELVLHDPEADASEAAATKAAEGELEWMFSNEDSEPDSEEDGKKNDADVEIDVWKDRIRLWKRSAWAAELCFAEHNLIWRIPDSRSQLVKQRQHVICSGELRWIWKNLFFSVVLNVQIPHHDHIYIILVRDLMSIEHAMSFNNTVHRRFYSNSVLSVSGDQEDDVIFSLAPCGFSRRTLHS